MFAVVGMVSGFSSIIFAVLMFTMEAKAEKLAKAIAAVSVVAAVCFTSTSLIFIIKYNAFENFRFGIIMQMVTVGVGIVSALMAVKAN